MLTFSNYIDNIHIEKYVGSMLNMYLYKDKVPGSCNTLEILAVQSVMYHGYWIPILLTIMPKYSNAKFEVSLGNFFSFVKKPDGMIALSRTCLSF